MRKDIKRSLIVWPLFASVTISAASFVQTRTNSMQAIVTALWQNSTTPIQADWAPVVLANATEFQASIPAIDADLVSTERWATFVEPLRHVAAPKITYEKAFTGQRGLCGSSDFSATGRIASKTDALQFPMTAWVANAPANQVGDKAHDGMITDSTIHLDRDWLSIQSIIDDICNVPFYDLTGNVPLDIAWHEHRETQKNIIGMRWLARMRNCQPTPTEHNAQSAMDQTAMDQTGTGPSDDDGYVELLPMRSSVVQGSVLPKSIQVLAKAIPPAKSSPELEWIPARVRDTSNLQERAFAHSPTGWPLTPSLMVMIEPGQGELASDRQWLDWTNSILVALQELQSFERLNTPQAEGLLESLARASDQGKEIAGSQSDRSAQIKARSIAYAIQRRVSVWQAVLNVSVASSPMAPSPSWVDDDWSPSPVPSSPGFVVTIDYADLLRKLEQQEIDPIDLVGSEIADAVCALRDSGIEDAVAVAVAIDRHYRNANMRMAVSESLLNRLLPKIDPQTVPVHTRMLGSNVRGTSHITSDLQVVLSPSDTDWNLRLLTLGQVRTQAIGTSGPVSVHTRGTSRFVAQTPIKVNPAGVHRGQVQVNVNGRTALRGIRTHYDRIPIVGVLLRNFANSKFNSIRPESNRLAAQQVRQRVVREMNETLDTRTQNASEKIHSLVMGPLEQLELEPQVVSMNTTADRIIARYRLAGASQLSAFTPRPQAPASSLMSLQVHQSAINNMLEQLIPRQTLMSIDETVDQAASVFHKEVKFKEALPEGVMIQFAKTRPVTVEIEEGKMWITLRVVQLSRGHRLNLTNFIVRAVYQPEVNGLQARLVRQGHLRISGPGMSMRERLPLRTIFNKVLSPDRPFPVTLPNLVSNPLATGLAVSQLELRAGWIGLAVSETDAPRIAWNVTP